MVGLIVALILSVPLTWLVIYKLSKLIKERGYSLTESRTLTIAQLEGGQELFNRAPLPEVDENMTDLEREEQLRILHQAWIADKL